MDNLVPKNVKDLTGAVTGKLHVVSYAGHSRSGTLWNCRCECGNITKVRATRITQQKTKSCGCDAKHDLTGKTFGRLTVKSYSGNTKGECCWICMCECGTEVIIRAGGLRSGQTQSCGCLKKQRISETTRKRKTTHGLSRTPLYRLWSQIKNRCYNNRHKKFHLYGGRGIVMCEQWRNDPKAFIDWVITNIGQKPKQQSIDRIDSNKNYEPGNIRWADALKQNNNKRTNLVVKIDGQKKTVTEWAVVLGVRVHLLRNRIAKGWSPLDVVLYYMNKANCEASNRRREYSSGAQPLSQH